MNESTTSTQSTDAVSSALNTLFPSLNLGVIFGSIAVVIFVIVLLKIIKRLFIATANRMTEENESKRRLARQLRVAYNIVRGVIVATAVLIILTMLGIDVSAIVAGLGIAGIIVGFVLQDALSDVVMSFRIVADDYFAVGDYVRFGTVEGEVIQMSSQSTKIRDIVNGDIHNISNRNITQITKLSDNHIIDVELSYDDDPKRIAEVLTAACEKIAALENAKDCILKGLQSFAPSAVVYRVILVASPKYRPDLSRAAHAIIREEISAAHLTIPYGQLDIHMPKEFFESASESAFEG